MNAVNRKMLEMLRIIRVLYVMRDVINAFLSGALDRQEAVERLWTSIDSTDLDIVYNSPANIMTECFFSIWHLTETGYETSDDEMAYFRDCIVKARVYDPDELTKFIRGLR